MQKRILVLLLLLVMLLTPLLAACNGLSDAFGTTGDKDSVSAADKNKLQILRSDLTLTQEQSLSRIKAEYLIQNNGYAENDPIVAIVTLPGGALIDDYLADANGAPSLADYAAGAEGQARLAEIEREQEALVAELTEKGLISGVECRYGTILNGVAVNTTYGNFARIGALASVSGTILSETYNRPQATSTDASAITNPVDVYDTGIFNSSSAVSASGEPFTGKHTAVAVLDSGFDCEHSVFASQPEGELLIKRQNVGEVLALTNAKKLDGSIELMDVYYSNKIPFVFDYADKDKNVNPYDSEHGTHVAGIIGGNDAVITGIAVDTQLVLMKVFPDLDDGGKTEDILAALEDAVLLKVDAINMSLGSSCGFSREADGDAINAVYDKINQSGISLITAASNSYSSAFGGEQGNTNKVTNPDSGTVGSPSTYPAALSVASISGTKSKYMVGNGTQVFFFNESNAVSGKPNDFFAELGIGAGQSKTYEYVTIPGVGMKANYAAFPEGYLKGKIALVRRGDTTFEDKALQAKNAGAAACIIYNNIEGDILMSMGKSDHIPTVSISKENGTLLAARETGTITISYGNQAGPFMSDFSSWGPSPDLKLKPEITAHGGNIKSSVPGGGYDELSGTSMATPNLCGIVVLIRQYLKEQYPDYDYKQISVMANQMLMSTATIIRNEEGNPYSPRKQGAGLASLYNVVNTPAYLTVDGIDRTKLELGDDPKRTGVYTMRFNVVNLSDGEVTYDLSLVAMTETVSRSDSDYVAEKDRLLGGNTVFAVDGGTLSGTRLTVAGGGTASVVATYTMTAADKAEMNRLFPYGMYVEGFVKLTATAEGGIDLNIPFLAFFGDWTEAPMFDKTYYEVESEAHNAAIDDEDKLKADYYATTPYGSYFYNYIIPLGTYLYDIDTSVYDAIPATEEHIAISDSLGTIDGLSAVYAGLLRNAKSMTYTIVDDVTGEEVWSLVVDNARKAYSNGGTPIPNYEYLRLRSSELGLINNRSYTFSMRGLLDYGDGGADTNVRNSFSFSFLLDNEAPVLKEVSYEKVYDKTLKKDRYYLTMTVYDNHYTQSITPIIFTSSSSYTLLTENPIPVYSEQGADTVVRFEITDYLEDIFSDKIITSALAFSIDDYALNSNIYLCQLPGTRGDFKFTKDGSGEGTPLSILSIYEDEVVDLTRYLYTADETVDDEKDYLRYLSWSSANEKVATVSEGQVWGVCAGRTTVTVHESMDAKETSLIINVRKRQQTADTADAAARMQTVEASTSPLNGGFAAAGQDAIRTMATSDRDIDDVSEEKIKSIRFTYFDTVFAYSRAAQTSKIGDTGDRIYVSALEGGAISFYPGEQIRLHYDLDPWYVADRYQLTFSSTNEKIATVDQDGKVTALKKGTATIVLKVEGSNLMARIKVTVNSEFVIENRTLVAYKGLGGEVVIPDDEGILYIGAYAFCLYDTDRTVELTDEDYDANKIPAANTTITSVIIPNTVEEIQKYAFYNCSGLQSVVIPPSVRFVREFAFAKDVKLQEVDLSHVEAIGREAFGGCESLTTADLGKVYAIGERAFRGCTALTEVDLTALRNTGKEAFKDCTALANVTFGPNTRLSEGMFARSGIHTVTLWEGLQIPRFCFAQCKDLTAVTLKEDLWKVGYGAFCECPNLTAVTFEGTVDIIDEQAFYDCTGLLSFTLPDSPVTLGGYAFYRCTNLAALVFGANTKIAAVNGAVLQETAITAFEVPAQNSHYCVSDDGLFLLSADKKTVVFCATGKTFDKDYTLPYEKIGPGAFCGMPFTSLTFTSPNTVVGDYAFANCADLTSVTFEQGAQSIGAHAFNYAKNLATAAGLDRVPEVGDYAFANTSLSGATLALAKDGRYGEGAFYNSGIKAVTVGANSSFGMGAFQHCLSLRAVNMPAAGGVSFGQTCFAYDTALDTIDLSKVERIEEQTFYGCSALPAANLQSAVYIGDYAFADCSTLNYISFPVVEEIGMGAFSRYDRSGGAPIFSGTDGTTKLTFPATLRVLGDGAFIGCEGLAEVDLSHVSSDGFSGRTEEDLTGKYWNYLFAYCIKLKKVTLPAAMYRVGQYAFAGCELLETVNLDHVREIDDYAFTSCTSLKAADLSAVEAIGVGAFASTALTGDINAPALVRVGDYAFQSADLLSFSAPRLAHIGEAAFQDNEKLTQFVFSADLAEVGVCAFLGCSALEDFCFFTDDGLQTTGTVNDYALLEDGVLYTVLPSGTLQLTAVPGGKQTDTLTVREGTVRIDFYAGNKNKNIKNIVLPASLMTMGNYAFYGYDALETVEFRSFTAPALESNYVKTASLDEKDPGYALLHNQFDLFNLELCYYHFVDLVGKKEPITMILPKNEDVAGYDALVYLVYFGPVSKAQRSEIEAMDTTTQTFITSAEQILALGSITLADEALINRAVSALNALKQDPAKFGYTEESWASLTEAVTSAKAELSALKLAKAPASLRELQARIDALPDTYDHSQKENMAAIAAQLATLTAANRNLLDLTRYTALLPAYDADTEEPLPDDPGTDDPTPPNGWQALSPALKVTVIAAPAVLLVAAAAVAVILWRKKKEKEDRA